MTQGLRKLITLTTLGEIIGVAWMSFVAYLLGWTDVVTGYGMLLLAATVFYLSLVAFLFGLTVLSVLLAVSSLVPSVSALTLQEMAGRLDGEYSMSEFLLQIGSFVLFFCVLTILAFAADAWYGRPARKPAIAAA